MDDHDQLPRRGAVVYCTLIIPILAIDFRLEEKSETRSWLVQKLDFSISLLDEFQDPEKLSNANRSLKDASYWLINLHRTDRHGLQIRPH